jgi:hypothetical protein
MPNIAPSQNTTWLSKGEFHFRKTQLFFATFFFCEKKKVEE